MLIETLAHDGGSFVQFEKADWLVVFSDKPVIAQGVVIILKESK